MEKRNFNIYFSDLTGDIPIVILLLGGNLTTLDTLCNGLKRGSPVVTVKVC